MNNRMAEDIKDLVTVADAAEYYGHHVNQCHLVKHGMRQIILIMAVN